MFIPWSITVTPVLPPEIPNDAVDIKLDLLPEPPTIILPSGIAKLGAFATYKSFAVIVAVDVTEPVMIWFPTNLLAELFTANVS